MAPLRAAPRDVGLEAALDAYLAAGAPAPERGGPAETLDLDGEPDRRAADPASPD